MSEILHMNGYTAKMRLITQTGIEGSYFRSRLVFHETKPSENTSIE